MWHQPALHSSTLLMVLGCALGGRRLEFVNRCGYPVVLHVTGGNTEVACEAGLKCAKGLTCNPDTNTCFFDLPKPATGWSIAAEASVVITTENDPIKQLNTVVADWSGKVEFIPDRSGEGVTRPPAFCNNLEHCPSYKGLNGVATAAEFTFVPSGTDFYDVSMINGVSPSMQMAPDGLGAYVTEEDADSHEGYNCGIAGAHAQTDGRLSNCTWDFDFGELAPLLTQVDGQGGGECKSNKDCEGQGLVCGNVAMVIKNPDSGNWQPTTGLSMQCGKKIGMWSAYQLCVWSDNTYKSPAPFEGVLDCPAMHSMFACADKEPWTTSCYAQTTTGPCCGCVDWSAILGKECPAKEACASKSDEWLREALPFYKPLKDGCPTAYIYAYDDMTSTFTCRSKKNFENVQVKNDLGYVITACPESNGIPDIPNRPVTPAPNVNPSPDNNGGIGLWIAGAAVVCIVIGGAAFAYSKVGGMRGHDQRNLEMSASFQT